MPTARKDPFMPAHTPAPWLHHQHRDGPGTIVVELAGELDLFVAEPLQRFLCELVDEPNTEQVIVDLGAVTFLDSAALGALITAYHHAQEQAGRFAVINVSQPVRRVLEITGMLDILSPSSR
jgi:anti-anti-sigma factor